MSTDLAKKSEPKKPTLLEMIQSPAMQKQFALALPKHMTGERFARIAVTAMRRTPKLQQCTPESILGCLMALSQYGLEPDGRRAHLIPFEDRKKGTVECTLILDFKGLVELAMRSGLVATIHCDVVCEGDIFEYNLGEIAKHVPWFLRRDKDRPEQEGEFFAVFAMVKNKDGTSKSEVLSIREVEGIRARSKSKDNGPWVTDFSEMAKKTAFKRLSKWLVLSPEFRTAVAEDDEQDHVVLSAEQMKRLSGHIEPSKTKVGAMLGNLDKDPGDEYGNEPIQQSEQDSESHMAECVEWLKGQIGVALDETDPAAGKVLFSLPNERMLILSEPVIAIPDGVDVVQVFDVDALQQCRNIYDSAKKVR